MKGYGTFQPSEGIHMRQYARAFVFQDEKSEDKVAFVSLDMHSTSQKLKQMVVHHLRKSQGLWGGNIKQNEQQSTGQEPVKIRLIFRHFFNIFVEFTEDNIMLCASHTHSGIGGYDLHALYELNVPSQGWREWVNTIINPSHTGMFF
jgi:neutral ceramidase